MDRVRPRPAGRHPGGVVTASRPGGTMVRHAVVLRLAARPAALTSTGRVREED